MRALPLLLALAAPALACSSSTAPRVVPPATADLTLTGALTTHASALPAHAVVRSQVTIPWPADSSSTRPQPTAVVILLTTPLDPDSMPQTLPFLNDGGRSVRITTIGQGISPIFWSTSGSVTFTSVSGNEIAGHLDAVLDAGTPTGQTVHLSGSFRAE